MKRTILLIIIMLAFLNMNAKVQLGNIETANVSNFEVNENILEISNTAKIVIPRTQTNIDNTDPILGQIKTGDPVKIYAGYNGDLTLEFTGYIREIESDYPLTIHCDDETYKLRQNNLVKAWRDTNLKQVLAYILDSKQLGGIKIEYDCPDVPLGKFQIDNASTFVVLQELMSKHGLYSRLQNNYLHIGLAYDFGKQAKRTHLYNLSFAPNTTNFTNPIVKNNLKYKRKEDYKVRFNAVATNSAGKKVKVSVGSKERDASERSLNFVGAMTEAQLRQKALDVLAKLVFDGYTGTITGFGHPITRAGDVLELKDYNEPNRAGKYLIEKLSVTFSESGGYHRTNTLGYKI